MQEWYNALVETGVDVGERDDDGKQGVRKFQGHNHEK